MAKTDKSKLRIFLCDCEGTMPLDGKALGKGLPDNSVTLCTNLCRAEIDRFSGAIEGDGSLLVACTQEAPLFEETAALAESKSEIRYTNIRENAGWSAQADVATPKMLALLADAQLEAPPMQTVALVSEGTVLVYGDDDEALKAARQLAARMDVTCLLKQSAGIVPPPVGDVALFRGTAAQVAGYLGAFEVTVKGLSASLPSARGELAFVDKAEDAVLTFDIVLDLTRDAPLVTGGERRDGYFKPDRGNPAAVQKALFEITNLVGEFEKPRYVTYDESLCVHSRNEIIGCSRCLDGCPAGAITPNGDTVTIDPHICGGCGVCASVCPTGAATYALPAFEFLVTRVRTLLDTYRKHSGKDPVLLVHDGDYGEEMIGILARTGRGLPANVLPLNVNEVTQLGFETLAAALAYGASEILILVGPAKKDDLEGLHSQIELTDAFTEGLGYGVGRITLIEEMDPEAVEAILYGRQSPKPPVAGNFLVLGGKRSTIDLALRHLHENAPKPVDLLALPDGAPFGTAIVDADGCTLCMSCVGACPTGAFRDDPDSPRLSFVEKACVQCGLCRSTCPENVITLEPRYNFLEAARNAVVRNEEEPFNCVSCGTAFGVKSSIEAMVEKLSGHSMFQGEAALNRIRMCPDCRIIDMAKAGDPALGEGGTRPVTRTTDDYLREAAEKSGKPNGRGNGDGRR